MRDPIGPGSGRAKAPPRGCRAVCRWTDVQVRRTRDVTASECPKPPQANREFHDHLLAPATVPSSEQKESGRSSPLLPGRASSYGPGRRRGQRARPGGIMLYGHLPREAEPCSGRDNDLAPEGAAARRSPGPRTDDR